MLYLNQLNYEDVPYEHNLKNGGPPPGKGTAAAAACGPCCLCMVVDHLTCEKLDLLDCLKLSAKVQANMDVGTDLKILGPVVAEMYGLTFETTDDGEKLKEHLQKGGRAIANSGGDREGHVGVFTHGGHYIEVLSVDGDEFCVLDPSYKEGKFEEEGRQGKVNVHAPFVYCSQKVLEEDCANRSPAYYLFGRKTNN